MYKKFAALLLAVIMVFAMFGCQGATEPNPNSTVAPTQGNNDPAQTNTETNTPAQNTEKVYTTYTQVYSAEVSTLNYLQSTATDVTVLGSLCVDGLVEFDRYGVMQPSLAESWDVSDDGTVYTFHLRKGVMWYTYEGEEYAEVKAGDFVAAAEYVLNAANASKVSNTLYHNIAGAKDYYDGTTTDFSTVGIKALDDYTVEYTLVAPLPYFIKMVSLNPWFPAQADFLAEQGDQFGTSNDTLLYCGAYLFDTFEPEYQRVLVMNENYWHSDIISIKKLVWKYNKEASANGPELYLRGETDKVTLGTDIIEEWKADPELWDQVHPAQLTNMSYWMGFNFNPQFEEQYNPSAWKTAANNLNFRKAMFYGYDRYAATMTLDAYTYKEKCINTYSRPGLVQVNDVDYLMMSGLDEYSTQENLFNADKAVEYKAKAMEELAGQVTFPILVYMPYNASNNATTKRVQVIEQQMEGVLGTDFIDIVLVGYSGSSFNADIRNAGNWAFMEVGWGPDYADPMSGFDPLLKSSIGSRYGSIFMAEDGYDAELGYGTFEKMALEANSITSDLKARYEGFAAAEKYLLDQAMVIPCFLSAGGYQACKLDPFSGMCGQMGDYGLRKLKGAVVLEKTMNCDEYAAAKEKYIAERTEARLAAEK